MKRLKSDIQGSSIYVGKKLVTLGVRAQVKEIIKDGKNVLFSFIFCIQFYAMNIMYISFHLYFIYISLFIYISFIFCIQLYAINIMYISFHLYSAFNFMQCISCISHLKPPRLHLDSSQTIQKLSLDLKVQSIFFLYKCQVKCGSLMKMVN